MNKSSQKQPKHPEAYKKHMQHKHHTNESIWRGNNFIL